ncbi:MAG: hypothetical protein ACREJ2_13100, partial [Planctomycetota bacterium]
PGTPPPEPAAPPAPSTPPAPPPLPVDAAFRAQFLALLPTPAAVAKPDAPRSLLRVRHALGASDSTGFSLTLHRPRIVVEPSRVTLDLDRHPIESLWFQDATGNLQPRGIFARLPLAPNMRNPVHPVITPDRILLHAADGSTLEAQFELPDTVRIGQQPSLMVTIPPQAGGHAGETTSAGGTNGAAGTDASPRSTAAQEVRPGLYTGEADLTLEDLNHRPLHHAQHVRLLVKVELVDELAFYRTWLPVLAALALALLLGSVVVLTRPRFVSHQLRRWDEGRPATRVYPLISFARGWWRHRAALAPEQPRSFLIRMRGLRRLGRPHAEIAAPAPGSTVFVNQVELAARPLRLRHGDLITVVSGAKSFRYFYFEYIPREEELPRYDGVTVALPGLYLDDGDFLLVDDEPAAPPSGAAAGAGAADAAAAMVT